jgi:RsiW-degrading membrane proteinase PrsW (M82 family)
MDPLTLVVGLLLSLAATAVPTAAWSLVVWWCDRYEREPAALGVAAFLWGALPAVLLALVFELTLDAPVGLLGPGLAGELAGSSVVAPVVEELVKGFALLLILWFWRLEFDDVVDGILYGALIGFGFAMTENLFYFMSALAEGGWMSWGATVVLRGLVFGLNHAIFTACTGAGLGYARMIASRIGRVGIPLLGLGAAIGLHALHNLGASLASVAIGAFLISFFNGFGGVVLVSLMIAAGLRRQGHWVRAELADEVGNLLTQTDYAGLPSMSGRRAMLAEARLAGGPEAMSRTRRFQELATELAFRKRRLRQRPGDAALAAQIAGLKEKISVLHPV